MQGRTEEIGVDEYDPASGLVEGKPEVGHHRRLAFIGKGTGHEEPLQGFTARAEFDSDAKSPEGLGEHELFAGAPAVFAHAADECRTPSADARDERKNGEPGRQLDVVFVLDL